MPSATGLRTRGQFIIALAVLSLLPLTSIHGQDWGSKMFDVKEIDFGVVPKRADAVSYLDVKNDHDDRIHVTELSGGGHRFMWGSGLPPIVIRSGQHRTLSVLANTRHFSGEFSSEVCVTVHDEIHETTSSVTFPTRIRVLRNVEVKSGSSNFEVVEHGTAAERKLVIQSAGNQDWRITGAVTENPQLSVAVKETGRDNGTVTHELLLSLKSTAPISIIRDRIRCTTNDPQEPQFSMAVLGRVEPAVKVTDSDFGKLLAGQSKAIFVVARSLRPIQIAGVERKHVADSKIPNDSLAIKFDAAEKPLHVMSIKLTAPSVPGDFEEAFELKIVGDSRLWAFKVRGHVLGEATSQQ